MIVILSLDSAPKPCTTVTNDCKRAGYRGCATVAIPAPVEGAFLPDKKDGYIWYHNGVNNSGK